jgi:hypothetical protein
MRPRASLRTDARGGEGQPRAVSTKASRLLLGIPAFAFYFSSVCTLQPHDGFCSAAALSLSAVFPLLAHGSGRGGGILHKPGSILYSTLFHCHSGQALEVCFAWRQVLLQVFGA